MVDGINNIASQIFSKLDSQDSKGTDNKIEASIWNKFVSDKGGKEISNYIKKENAVKSIISYLTNMSKKVGCTVEELANQWLGKSEANPSEISGEKSKLNSKSVDVPAIVVNDESDNATTESTERFQENVNKSLELISDIANGKYKYNVSTKVEDSGIISKTITLKDGRNIQVRCDKDEQGKLKVYEMLVHYDKGGTVSIHGDGSLWNSPNGWLNTGDTYINISNKEDRSELFKVISGILGEDVEV